MILSVFPDAIGLSASGKVLYFTYSSSDFTSFSVRIATLVTLSAIPGKKGELADSYPELVRASSVGK